MIMFFECFQLFDASFRILHWIAGFCAGASVFDVKFSNSVWNSIPVNSPPGSCMHRWGHGYHANQHRAYFFVTLSDVFSSILTSSTRLVTVSIAVSALNSHGLPRT